MKNQHFFFKNHAKRQCLNVVGWIGSENDKILRLTPNTQNLRGMQKKALVCYFPLLEKANNQKKIDQQKMDQVRIPNSPREVPVRLGRPLSNIRSGRPPLPPHVPAGSRAMDAARTMSQHLGSQAGQKSC